MLLWGASQWRFVTTTAPSRDLARSVRCARRGRAESQMTQGDRSPGLHRRGGASLAGRRSAAGGLPEAGMTELGTKTPPRAMTVPAISCAGDSRVAVGTRTCLSRSTSPACSSSRRVQCWSALVFVRLFGAEREDRSASNGPGGHSGRSGDVPGMEGQESCRIPGSGWPKTFFKSFLEAMFQPPAIFSILRSWTWCQEETKAQASFKVFKLSRRTLQHFSGSQKIRSMSSNGRIGWLGSTMSLG